MRIGSRIFAGIVKASWSLGLVYCSIIPVQASSEHVHPEGYKVLILIGVVIFVGILFFLKGRFGRNNPREKITIRVQMYTVPSGSKNSQTSKAFLTRIANNGTSPVEILAPVIRFGKGDSSRSYRVKSPGKVELYPLYLSPGTDHEFRVDLNKFYEADPLLRSFKKLSIEVSNKQGRELAVWYANNMQTKKSYKA